MKVLNIRPAREGSSAVARFDLELTDQVRLFGLVLKCNEAGQMRIFAPKSGGVHAASFNPEIATEITLAACAAIKGNSHYEIN